MAIDDLARVAGVERAGVGDWEEGKKRGGGWGCRERVRNCLPFSLPMALFPFPPFPSLICACYSGSTDDCVSCYPDVS